MYRQTGRSTLAKAPVVESCNAVIFSVLVNFIVLVWTCCIYKILAHVSWQFSHIFASLCLALPAQQSTSYEFPDMNAT